MYKIRKMKIRDIPEIYKIECACFRSPWSKYSLLSELNNSIAHYFVLESEDRIAGYTGMWVMFDEAHVTNIAVLQEFRGRGYSKVLMKAMMECAVANGADKMTLEVRETNTIAQNLYFKFGFSQNGFRPRYYEDTGEGALLLWNNDLKSTLSNKSLFKTD